MASWDAQKMLDKYIHDYLVKKGMHTTAETFANEANVNPTIEVVKSPVGLLVEWWELLYDTYTSNHPGHVQESVAEVEPQEKVPIMSPDEEVTSKLQGLEMHNMSFKAPSATNSSPPMQQMPNRPQQLEDRDEKSGIYIGRKLQMEPNTDVPTKALVPKPEPFDTGSYTASCSGMQQTP